MARSRAHRHPGHPTQDLILLQAIVFTVAIVVVLINIMIDVVYKSIDPRLKLTMTMADRTPHNQRKPTPVL